MSAVEKDFASGCGNGCAATVGTFDGLHRGHLLVVETLKDEARRHGLAPLVMPLVPHPLKVIAPERAPLRIMSQDEELRRLGDLGVEVSPIAFTADVRRLTVGEWMSLLHERFGVERLVMGYDNTFGSDGRAMSHEEYVETGRRLGIDVTIAPQIPGVSSTAIRRAIGEGRLDEAADMLGRPYTVSGEVVHGDALGRTIGFPTANLAVDPDLQLPPNGVYAGIIRTLEDSAGNAERHVRPGRSEAVANGDGSMRRVLVNIGTRPTVSSEGERRVEVHIPGFEGNLYGKELCVELQNMVREERRFATVEELRRQLERDVKALGDSVV